MSIFKNFNEKEITMLKRGIILLFGFLNILILLIGAFFIVTTSKALQSDETPRPQLSVNGEGKIFVRPDIAIITVAAITDAKRIADAQKQNTDRSNAVINFLKQNGIEEKDIKTSNYSIQPQYRYDDGRPCLTLVRLCPQSANASPRIVSYEVRHSLEIRVHDLNKIDDLVQGVVSAGGNEVESVVFAVDSEKSAMEEARRLAIEDAVKKARILAGDLGVRLVKITGFSEAGRQPIYGRSFALAEVAEGNTAPAPRIEPGDQEIRLNVTITYEFR